MQRELLTRYHVNDPGEFFTTVSFWDVPSDPTVQGNTGAQQDAQPPYYLLAGLPNQEGASFQLTSALVSLRRQFLASYMSASSDPANYGKISVLQLPSETQTQGPQQVQAQFLGSPTVSQELNLLRQNQTTIDYGNLLTLPVAGGLLYVEPVYIERAGQEASYPQLARVLVSYGGRVGYSASLSEALEQVFGAGAAPSAAAPGAPQAGAAGGSPAAAGRGNRDQQCAEQAEGRPAVRRLRRPGHRAGRTGRRGAALPDRPGGTAARRAGGTTARGARTRTTTRRQLTAGTCRGFSERQVSGGRVVSHDKCAVSVVGRSTLRTDVGGRRRRARPL